MQLDIEPDALPFDLHWLQFLPHQLVMLQHFSTVTACAIISLFETTGEIISNQEHSVNFAC